MRLLSSEIDWKSIAQEVVALARRAIEHYLKTGTHLPTPPSLSPVLLSTKGGVFVSLKKGKSLRGCIGTFLPQRENLAQEIIHNAVSAAVSDPRFLPVQQSELPEITISVDVLSPLELVQDKRLLDPRRYGVLVESGWKRGLLLPDLEGINTVEEQLRIAMGKAGITPHEPVTIYRFTVERFREEKGG
ncbi:MAG: AmmeMemoRadiSam system protein A [Atribacterota bacterium]|nr:AmmeMemoRadiSam system protein A [Atribacterota bacterium]